MATQKMTLEEMRDEMERLAPEVSQAACSCVETYSRTLGAILGGRPEAEVQQVELNRLGSPGHAFVCEVDAVGVRYTATLTISMDDQIAPYVTVAGWLGRGVDRHLIEFRLERDDHWETCSASEPALASWVSDQVGKLAARAQDVAALAAPILQAFHPDTPEYAGLIVVVPAEDGNLSLRLEE